jgi:phenol 2-monooxygenase (NADPH)
MPPLMRPAKGVYGLWDYEKVSCADLRDGQDIFSMREIDRASGCIVVVRPDQHVAHVLTIDAFDHLSDFFAGVLLPV